MSKNTTDALFIQLANRNYFVQEEPKAFQENPFTEDRELISILNRVIPKKIYGNISNDLTHFGKRIKNEVAPLAKDATQNRNNASFKKYSGFGKKIDEIWVSKEWRKLHDIAAEEGLIQTAYDRTKNGAYARLHQMVKVYMFSPDSASVTCPLAMTDGAARLLEQLLAEKNKFSISDEQEIRLRDAFNHYTSRDPKKFWTSGQFMTERRSGSDVNAGTTVGIKDENEEDLYHLFGYKFFTSATTANTAFTLGRIIKAKAKITEDNKLTYDVIEKDNRVSLFFMMMRNEKNELNNISVEKMKDKLGTKSLPTAELKFNGVRAHIIGKPERGVANISYLFNATRIWSFMGSLSAVSRIYYLIEDYSSKRRVFGKYLIEHPLHIKTLSKLNMVFKGLLQLFVHVTLLLGHSENESATIPTAHLSVQQVGNLLRLLTPICKLYGCKLSIYFIQEVLELFGGFGYLEDALQIPAFIRDAQVNNIWEGPSNVLSLDVLRAITKNHQVMTDFISDINYRLDSVEENQHLSSSVENIRSELEEIKNFLLDQRKNSKLYSIIASRSFAYSVAKITISTLLIEHANFTNKETDVITANYWSSSSFPLHFDLSEFNNNNDPIKHFKVEQQILKSKL
eukprot:TRINITY_DN11570_c0_g1_i1.p1 TRINITY_DN11570_c0_g1~~TRINITY_DN11570_c0_g1_i1.p1  ORF type:complete len:625 (-),score=207.27 TRINITY_DN11570_c0_g1_i1:1700-3574(-)